MDCWIHTSVVLNDSWGLGADDILKTPLGKNPEFTLRPRYLRDSQGKRQVTHFTVEFSSGYLPDGWQGATFTPLGVDPVQGITGLEEWEPGQKTSYRDKINAAAKSLGNPRTVAPRGRHSVSRRQGRGGLRHRPPVLRRRRGQVLPVPAPGGPEDRDAGRHPGERTLAAGRHRSGAAQEVGHRALIERVNQI